MAGLVIAVCTPPAGGPTYSSRPNKLANVQKTIRRVVEDFVPRARRKFDLPWRYTDGSKKVGPFLRVLRFALPESSAFTPQAGRPSSVV